MASERNKFLGLNTDSPPDRLGDQLFDCVNLIPRSPTSVVPRPGSSFVRSIAGGNTLFKGVYSHSIPGETSSFTGLVLSYFGNDSGGIKSLGVYRPRDTSWITESTDFAFTYNVFLNSSIGNPYFLQFADRMFIFFEDLRPYVTMRAITGQSLAFCPAGILPPATAPTAADHADNANNLAASDVLTIAYGFYSSSRNTFSRLSPTVAKSLAATPKKVTINGFESPRDGLGVDIDYIVIAVQSGTALGLMAHTDYTYLYINPNGAANRFTTASFTFDVSGATLEDGFSYTDADPYFDVLPTVKHADVHGNRLWLGGQSPHPVYDIALGTPTIDRNQSYRGLTLTKITVVSGAGWADRHRFRSVYFKKTTGGGSYYLGELYDITSDTVAYLDRNIPADLATFIGANPGTIVVLGYNDRVYPTSYHNFTMGGIPTVFPECVNLLDAQLIESAVDTGQKLQGIKQYRDDLAIVFNDSVSIMSGGDEVNTPLPAFRQDWGRMGCVAPRSICTDGEGNLAWIGEEGICIGNSAGVRTIAFELGINRLFKGSPWIAVSDLPNMVMTWSREYDGFVIGNFTIGGASNYWGLLTMQPQIGFWLFNGQKITSNIVEVIDANGQGMLLAGDYVSGNPIYGRLKKILDPSVLTDIDTTSGTAPAAAAYTWSLREGWISRQDGQPAAAARLQIPGLNMPGSSVALTGTLWRENYPRRQAADIAAADKITLSAITEADLLRDIPLATGSKRYFSLALSGLSNTGASGTRPLEICRWRILFDEDGKTRRQ